MAQTPAERKAAQRRTANSVKNGGTSPIAGFGAISQRAAARQKAKNPAAGFLQPQQFPVQSSDPMEGFRQNMVRAGYAATYARPIRDTPMGDLRDTLNTGAMQGSLAANGNTMWDFGTKVQRPAARTRAGQAVKKGTKATGHFFRNMASKHAGKLAKHLENATGN